MKVSIITPVYNAEQYIRQCFDSLIAQTLQDFEVILIDDGSKDNSGRICDEYAEKDSRFKVFHFENGGVSLARQRGLERATGEYTIHVDPDDWVDEDMLENLVEKAEQENADYVICDFLLEGPHGTRYVKQDPGDDLRSKTILKKLFLELHGSCCNKLIRRTCCKGIGFTPTSIVLHEDGLFNIRVMTRDIKVAYLPKAFYHYRQSVGGSLCSTYSLKHLRSGIEVVTELEKIMQEHDNLEESDVAPYKIGPLFFALMNKKFDLMKELYPEVHPYLIERGRKLHLFISQGYCLSLALRGYPRTAYYLYKGNLRLLRCFQRIKRLIKK
jgi:glycosyltransferase involved in cell wall biosynthesis